MRDALNDMGGVGRDLLAVDWDATSLGPPETWPNSLRTTVRLVLTSKFSMWMAWGPELVFFCNEAYRRDTLGTKYPWALGRPASEVWSEIWADIGPRIDRVITTGEATWDEQLQLFLERSGYVEETYHTFSYSPLTDDAGSIAGMLCVVKEDTEQVIAARRMATLRDLGVRTMGELSETEMIAAACERLGANQDSLPFSMLYLFDEDGGTARLAGTAGFTGEHPAAPRLLRTDDARALWPARELLTGDLVDIDLTAEGFPELPSGAWPEPPLRALAVQLLAPSQTSPYGFLVVGLNRYRPLDEGYRSFVQLVAGQLAAALTDARAYEFERRRAESLARIDQAKTDFFTNVSHEFRTPLTLLLGPAEDALADEEEPLPPRQRARTEVIHRNGQRLLKLVNSLLDFSRLESGRITSRFEPVDLSGYTAELVSMFRSSAERAGLRLEVDCEPLSSPVHVDPEHWAKIVLNLVSNALKFTFSGSILVSVTEEDGTAVLRVRDTGIGIPPQETAHLFERFHRVRGARSRTHEGSGIGLALVAELAALHGGEVTADSTVNEGSTFTVRVPFGTSHLPADQLGTGLAQLDGARLAAGFVAETTRWVSGEDLLAPADVPLAESDGKRRARVLVVDDNVDMRAYVASLLAAEYVVDTAVDGLDALDRMAAHLPDLVLTDVMMPRLDGFGLLARIQSHPATADLPVIMLSARAGEEGTLEGLEAGADDYLSKPFSARELLARVRVNVELDRQRRLRTALERSQELLDRAESLARVGSWEIDLDTDTVHVSDELSRLFGVSRSEIERRGFGGVVDTLIHPEDRRHLLAALAEGAETGTVDYEVRLTPPSGEEILLSVRGEVVKDADRGRVLRGSAQDITEQRAAERSLAEAAARMEAATREHTIADELQRSLLPERSYDLEHLDVATYYRAGVEGTQVGGDWYDIIDLGAGRTAFVVGDVMGRGVRAASVMGQLRSAVRAFAKLDLPPSDILEHVDGVVQDLDGDQMVTCVYAVFDSGDQSLRVANAGHLPPLLVTADRDLELVGTTGPPLGAGYFGMSTDLVQLAAGATVTFYTDGLVERRDRDLDVGIDALGAQLLQHADADVQDLPATLVSALLPDGPEDDVAVLVTRVDTTPLGTTAAYQLPIDESMPATARRMVRERLRDWEVATDVTHDVVLMVSEVVTNAYLHGRPPIDLRLRLSGEELTVEVHDRGAYRPRRQRPTEEDEHGRGLQIVSTLADSWGSRASGAGKCVWFTRGRGRPAVD
ncbi:SpoIIE family protein phosphatase [Nocardioides mesophilus]|uniref:histidine kinase n=1 Tax=Nocardioides mesophilus TaxID=433659 RepID=A0A7G9R7H4_9ACTN|nr:SpoIIE family protein phosphatase [Nocardioides mesophilus]QNN51549.1 SpoIIE family protein phosphatase [Nocardioides mesophilus]